MWLTNVSKIGNFFFAFFFPFSSSPFPSPSPSLLHPFHCSSFFSLSPILHPAFLPGIPTLIILDEEGNVITTQGRGAITSDPDGKVSHAHDVVSSELKVRCVI